MKRYKILGTLIIVGTLINPCNAKVFDLIRFFKGSSMDINELLGDKRIMNEPVTINGVPTTLHVGIIDVSLKEYAIKLRSMNPKLRIKSSKNSIYYKKNLGNGMNELHYLTQVSDKYPVVHFSMKMPQKMPETIPWPKELPIPGSAKADLTLTFNKRGSTFASFTTILSPKQAEQEITNTLLGAGWEEPGGSTQQFTSETGGVFFNPNERKMLIVSFLGINNGTVTGSIYMKPIK